MVCLLAVCAIAHVVEKWQLHCATPPGHVNAFCGLRALHRRLHGTNAFNTAAKPRLSSEIASSPQIMCASSYQFNSKRHRRRLAATPAKLGAMQSEPAPAPHVNDLIPAGRRSAGHEQRAA
jgi:hypothetical protein